MERFHDRVIINGYEQTFYEGIAEALGYPNNKEPFQKLAGAIRLNTLKELLPKRISKAEKVLHIQSLMFGTAGLIEFKGLDTAALTADDRNYFEKLQTLWEKKYRSRISAPMLTESAWKFGGIRPANFPLAAHCGPCAFDRPPRGKGVVRGLHENFSGKRGRLCRPGGHG